MSEKEVIIQRMSLILCLLTISSSGISQADESRPYELLDLKHIGPVISLAWSSDGRYLAGGALPQGYSPHDGELAVWDFKEEKRIVLESDKTAGQNVDFLQFQAGTDHLVADYTFVWEFWSVSQRQPDPAWQFIKPVLQGGKGEYRFLVRFHWSDDGSHYLIRSEDGVKGETAALNVFRTTNHTNIFSLDAAPSSGRAGPANLSFDGKKLIVDWAKSGFKVYDTASGKVLSTFQPEPLAPDKLYEELQWVPGTDQLVLRSGEYLWLIDTTTGKTLWVRRGQSVPLYDMDVSRDGKWIATAGANSTVLVRDIATGRIRRSVKIEETTGRGTPNAILAVAFSPDGKQVAFGANDCGVYLWDHEKSQVGPYSDETPAEPAQPKSTPRQPTPINP